MPEHILAIDQGTTSTRAIVFDSVASPVASAQIELSQYFPQPGWIEHDPIEIAEAAVNVARQAIGRAQLAPGDIAAIGITNQRETTIVWERETGRPVANAIVWQDRRTAEICLDINKTKRRDIRQVTGLVVDPYFSATKLMWLLSTIPNGQARAEAGELCFGTVDSWLLWHLTNGEVHATDATNASRTMLLNLHDLQWDPEMLRIFDIPEVMLPEVRGSADDFGVTDKSVFGAEIPITAMAGDQHAALYGQTCFKNGQVKCTYGTGAFVLANKGTNVPLQSSDGNDAGLLTTLGYRLGSRKTYAIEGSVFVTGATVQWLRDGLGVISNALDTVDMAMAVGSNAGVYFVPAFVGLGAPHWQPDATGSITGLTRGSDKNHIVRAALESTAYQVKDVVDAMEAGRPRSSQSIRADGGQSANPFVMQFQADILDRPVEVASITETTALGAAFLAGRGIGLWRSDSEIEAMWKSSAVYEPSMSESERNSLYSGWLEALRRTSPRI
ncbi:MAG TPA: glycerol kinase GlpK [Dehalococcoidia bacterium]|jgi:glycerol kinase|nr:glycerol kinase [Chloroflexota bacterium]MDP6055360.1 glycerol kinase GlpK [Dehalococcoidia bacterium]MDP7261789.1 glycerol kinase GlpK [Dehalococcoidia bacterium]MDP7486276.1 glycerol kinase GlpK [Dehalococcoidia bacterium]HJP27486.1 glycerol kinase GlpK [Dehalococcoidia bacterium]|tara:strand:+ start:2059 stop:3558 length:1500 start_codon:yes stop_codon:yes gene_type:complete